MSRNDFRRNALRLAVMVPLLAITPLALTPADGVRENRACADDTCWERIGDVCYYKDSVLEDHYLTGTVD